MATNGEPHQQRPILPPLTTRRERKDRSKLVVMPPLPSAPLNQDVWDPIDVASIQQPPALAPPQPSAEIEVFLYFKLKNFFFSCSKTYVKPDKIFHGLTPIRL